jgi:hypothetical protein
VELYLYSTIYLSLCRAEFSIRASLHHQYSNSILFNSKVRKALPCSLVKTKKDSEIDIGLQEEESCTFHRGGRKGVKVELGMCLQYGAYKRNPSLVGQRSVPSYGRFFLI